MALLAGVTVTEQRPSYPTTASKLTKRIKKLNKNIQYEFIALQILYNKFPRPFLFMLRLVSSCTVSLASTPRNEAPTPDPERSSRSPTPRTHYWNVTLGGNTNKRRSYKGRGSPFCIVVCRAGKNKRTSIGSSAAAISGFNRLHLRQTKYRLLQISQKCCLIWSQLQLLLASLLALAMPHRRG